MGRAIPKGDRVCALCGENNGNLDIHHIFGGNNRKNSEKHGMVVWLCHTPCHEYGERAVHCCHETKEQLHQMGQRMFMEENNCGIAEFVSVFGMNYLDEEW